jgi:hypothetical protein
MHESICRLAFVKDSAQERSSLVQDSTFWRWKQLYYELRQDTEKMLMSLDTTPVMMFVALASGVVVFVLVMFLPALFELKNPKDSGPRKIVDDALDAVSQMKIVSLERDEETQVDQALVKKMASVLSVLPDLESQL